MPILLNKCLFLSIIVHSTLVSTSLFLPILAYKCIYILVFTYVSKQNCLPILAFILVNTYLSKLSCLYICVYFHEYLIPFLVYNTFVVYTFVSFIYLFSCPCYLAEKSFLLSILLVSTVVYDAFYVNIRL